MIGDPQTLVWSFWQVELHQDFAYIPRQLRHTRRFFLQRVAGKHMSIIFHSRATA